MTSCLDFASSRPAPAAMTRYPASPSATRRASSLERSSTRSACDSLVIEIELKRKSPSLVSGHELVVRLHDRARERSRRELRGGGLGDLVAVERVLLRRPRESDG